MRAPFTAILLGLLLLDQAHAQSPAPAPRPEGQGEGQGVSELMVATQFRHIKLWFAGKFGNWKLAGYELDQLASSLDQAAQRVPVGAAPEEVARQVTALRGSIEARDVAAFTKAYGELTANCNDCHRAAGRAYISVQVPSVSPFADQDFADQIAEGRTLAHTICGVCHVVPDKPIAPPLSPGFAAPSFVELAGRSSVTEARLRQLLATNHRRVGPAQAMPNPRLNDNQIEDIVAYFEALKAEQKR